MVQTPINLTPKDYKSEVKPTWCPGCGDFGVLNAVYRGLANMKLTPEQTVVVSGIGCSSFGRERRLTLRGDHDSITISFRERWRAVGEWVDAS